MRSTASDLRGVVSWPCDGVAIAKPTAATETTTGVHFRNSIALLLKATAILAARPWGWNRHARPQVLAAPLSPRQCLGRRLSVRLSLYYGHYEDSIGKLSLPFPRSAPGSVSPGPAAAEEQSGLQSQRT